MAKPVNKQLARRIGVNIAKYRKLRGWTQERLAEALSVEPFTVSRYETGAILPSLTTLDAAAQALLIDLSALLENVSENTAALQGSAVTRPAFPQELTKVEQSWLDSVVLSYHAMRKDLLKS